MDYWKLIQNKKELISSHIIKDKIFYNEYQGAKYTWYPVEGCPLITGQLDDAVVCVEHYCG